MLELTDNALMNDRFSVYNVQPLHLLHLGISKILKECKVGYIAATENYIIRETKKNAKASAFSKSLRLNAFNNHLFSYQKTLFPGLQLPFQQLKSHHI